MWFFNKKVTLRESGLFEGFCDCHCHLLPGVDDGVKEVSETLEILGLWETLGVSEVWLTPHIMEDMPNMPNDLKARFEELKSVYNGNIKLHLAAEHMMDGPFMRRLAEGEVMRIGFNENENENENRAGAVRGIKNENENENENSAQGASEELRVRSASRKGDASMSVASLKKSEESAGAVRGIKNENENENENRAGAVREGNENENQNENDMRDERGGEMLLVETSYYTPPMNLDMIVERVKSKGYVPILAHPERYQYMDKQDYVHWKNRGVLLQLNLPSIVGAYGPDVEYKALWLLKENMYDYCGTDTHSLGQVEFFIDEPISNKVVNRLRQLLSTNRL